MAAVPPPAPLWQRSGRLTIEEPTRHLTRPCFHLSKKIDATVDGAHGVARFPWGDCEMLALETGPNADRPARPPAPFTEITEAPEIRFHASAADEASLARVCGVIDAHERPIARHRTIEVRWSAASPPREGRPT